MKRLFVLFVFLNLNIFSQHLPLSIGNQWHYNQGLGFSPANAAIAVDTVQINNKTYYKIECRQPVTYNLLWTTYDRMEGDSLYYRWINNEDVLVFNFGWENGHIESTPIDTNCFSLLFIYRGPSTMWGIQTEYYGVTAGYYCIGWSDTSWALSGFGYLKYFGALNANDGSLIGAVINGETFGTLHILPVELVSFTAEANKSGVLLKWITATEVNNKGFEIERTLALPSLSEEEGEEWKTIGFVPGKGTTSMQTAYSFKDAEIKSGIYNYRLKQIDFNGNDEYSDIVEVSVGLPEKYSLEQNFPNPFNPVTSITYQIPEKGPVQLLLYDILGNKAATLTDEVKEPGRYTILLDGTGLSSGIYIYQLNSGSFQSSKKLILIK